MIETGGLPPVFIFSKPDNCLAVSTLQNAHAARPGWLGCCLTAMMGALPLCRSGFLVPHDLQRSAECLILLATALVLWHKRETVAFRQGSGPQLGTMGLLFALVLASCWQSQYPAVALQETALWLGLLGWAWLFHQHARAGSDRALLRTMVVTLTAYAAVVLLLYVAALASAELLDARALIIGFSNPRFLNHVQTVAVPLLWVVAVSDSDRRWRTLAMSAAVAHIALAALSLSRATLLAWLAVLVMLTILQERRVSRHGWICLVSGLTAAVLLFVALPNTLNLSWRPSFANPATIHSAHSRDLLWSAAMSQFLHSPWLGQGPMHFAAQVNGTAAHPHNIYLQIAAELGLPAALLLLGFVLAPIAKGIRHLRNATTTPAALLTGSLAASVAALVDGMFSGNFVMPLSQLWIASTFGLFTGALARVQPVAPNPRLRGAHLVTRWMLGLLVVAQLGLCAAAAIQVSRRPPRMRADSPVPVYGETYRPRFWLDGWI